MQESPLIQIDLHEVLRQKLGSKAKYVPSSLVDWLRRKVHEDEINRGLRIIYPKRGVDFCDGALDFIEASVHVVNPEKLPPVDKRRLIIVSNHPLGGLDGIAIISSLSRVYGDDLRFVVNDILMAIEPLSEVFLPINKHGSQDRTAIGDINRVMESDVPVVIFPAGLVSRRGPDGQIRDLQWHKMFVSKAVEYKRDVLPIYFSGENSSFFYNFARWRKRLGLKFNIEMIYLPDEMFRCRGNSFTITVGDVIPWQSLRTGKNALDQAQEVKEIVYSLKAKEL